jgi:hypothetical protein
MLKKNYKQLLQEDYQYTWATPKRRKNIQNQIVIPWLTGFKYLLNALKPWHSHVEAAFESSIFKELQDECVSGHINTVTTESQESMLNKWTHTPTCIPICTLVIQIPTSNLVHIYTSYSSKMAILTNFTCWNKKGPEL